MQKKLIALAVAGLASGAAFADNVTMYGVVDAAMIHTTASGLQSAETSFSGGLSTSRIGVKGVEDLGNGLKVVANLEYGLNTQDVGGIGNARQEMLALAGNFGTVATGRLQTTGYDFANKFDPTSGSQVSPLGNMTIGKGFLIGSVAGAARADRAVAYISPNFSGFSFAANHAWLNPNLDTVVDQEVTANLLSASYDNGPLSVGVVYAVVNNPSPAFDPKEWSLGASYDAGFAKISGTYQSQKQAVGGNNKVWSLGGVIPAGPGAVVASVAQTNMAANNVDATGYTLGYLYPMSKRDRKSVV